MKQNKRLLALLLSLLLALSLLPAAALAADEPSGDPEEEPQIGLAESAQGTISGDAVEGCLTRVGLAVEIYKQFKEAIDSMAQVDAPSFTDIVGANEEQQAAIEALYKARIIGGTGANTFSPEVLVTRADVAVVLWRVTGCRTNDNPPSVTLSDVTAGDWYAAAVNYLYGAGILSGTGNGAFNPAGNITATELDILFSRLASASQTTEGGSSRIEMVAEAYNTFKDNVLDGDLNTELPFPDISDCTEVEKAALAFFVDAGVVQGQGDGNFNPFAAASNFQIAVFLRNCAEFRAESAATYGIAVIDDEGNEDETQRMQAYIDETFQFLADQGGIDIAGLKANPHAPGLKANITIWGESLKPSKPVIRYTEDTTTVTISAAAADLNKDVTVYYTTDGMEPGLDSVLYEEPFVIEPESVATIKAIAVNNNLISEVTAYDLNAVYTVTIHAGTGGAVAASPTSAKENDTVTLTVTPNEGYQLDALTVTDEAGNEVSVSQSAPYTFTMPADNVIVNATFKAVPSHDNSGDSSTGSSNTGSSNSGSNSTGSTPASKPASKTTTTTNADGSTTTTTTNADGSSVSTTTAVDGSKTVETTNTDGSKVSETTKPDGSTGTVRTDANGNVTGVETAVSGQAVAAAAASGAPVTLPVEVRAADSSAGAAPIDVTMPANSGFVAVDIPVANATNTTVAVIVHADGTEEIVKMSTVSAGGVLLALDGSATIKIVDNAKSFNDVTGGQWFAANVAWATSHEIMNGMGDGGFSPHSPTSRAMLAQMLFNLDGAASTGRVTDAFADVSADQWFAESVTWAFENGIAQGDGTNFNVDQSVTREQMVVMIYNYAQAKGYDTGASANLSEFTDGGSVSSWARNAMSWAVSVGVIGGMDDGTVAPQGETTRAQLAAIMERFVRYAMQ